MANRAYLFSTDNLDISRVNNFEKPYYDSRWNIPLLWFLFFDPGSIKMRRISSSFEPENFWEEINLVETKGKAIIRFEKLLPQIRELFDLSEIKVESFIQGVRNWEGQYLILDPGEIIQSEGEKEDTKTLKDFARAFELLEKKQTQEAVEILDPYAGEFNNVLTRTFNFTNYFIGYTY